MPRWLTATLLFLILTVAAIARFAWIGHYSYFIDETWNDEVSTGRGSVHCRLANDELHTNIPKLTSLRGAEPWWRVWSSLQEITHPPLYLIVLRWWRDIFGESPVISRACSATLSALAILLLFDVARLLHGTRAALWACLIMALAGAQIELAQEVRPYALLLLVSMGALSALVRFEKLGTSRRRVLALFTCVLGMVLTHYFAAGPALAIGVYALLRLRGKARRDALIALVVAAFVFAIIWGPFFWQQRGAFSVAAGNWLSEGPDHRVMNNLERLTKVPLRLLMHPPNHTFPLGYVAGVILCLPFVLLRKRPELLLWCVWIGGTIFTIAAMDLVRSTHHLSFIRYTLIGGPAIYMTLASLFPSHRLIANLISGCVALACLGALPEAYSDPKPEFRVLASYLDSNIQPGDAVVFYADGPNAWYCSFSYLNTSYYSGSYPWPFVMMTHAPNAELIDRLSKYRAVWLVDYSNRFNSETLVPGGQVDGVEYFPFVATCERITPTAFAGTTRPIVGSGRLH